MSKSIKTNKFLENLKGRKIEVGTIRNTYIGILKSYDDEVIIIEVTNEDKRWEVILFLGQIEAIAAVLVTSP